MKRWIAKQWIALAEVFGWPVPSWIRHLVPATELDELLHNEKELTNALQSDSPEDLPMPAFLDTRIERSIVETGEVPKRGAWWTGILVPASAFALAVVVGFVMLSDRDSLTDFPDPQPELAIADAPSTVNSAQTLDRIDKSLASLEKGLIMKPLAMEQERLTSDVTSALQFFTSSVLPDSYAADVNSRLDALKGEMGKSI
jgi:hypothetical protein